MSYAARKREEKSIQSKPPVYCTTILAFPKMYLYTQILNLHNTLNLLSTITGKIDVAMVRCSTVVGAWSLVVFLSRVIFLRATPWIQLWRETGHDTTISFYGKILSCLLEDQKLNTIKQNVFFLNGMRSGLTSYTRLTINQNYNVVKYFSKKTINIYIVSILV